MTRVPVLDIDASAMKAAIYYVDSANQGVDSPLYNPSAHVADLKFHSDWDYPRIVSDNIYSVTLADVATWTTRNQKIVLANHGQAGVPLVFGAFQVPGGVGWCPLSVGTPSWVINTNTGAYSSPMEQQQLLSLGANSTQILLHESTWARYTTGTASLARVPAKTFNVRVVVTDTLL